MNMDESLYTVKRFGFFDQHYAPKGYEFLAEDETMVNLTWLMLIVAVLTLVAMFVRK